MQLRRAGGLVVGLLLGTIGVSWPDGVQAQTLPIVTVTGTSGFLATAGFNPCLPPPPPGPPTVGLDVSFIVTLTGTFNLPVEVHLSWGGTAVPGVDYQTPPTSITFTPGTSEITLSAGITATSANKTIVLTIVEGSGYTVGDPATATTTVGVLAIAPAVGCVVPPPVEATPPFTG